MAFKPRKATPFHGDSYTTVELSIRALEKSSKPEAVYALEMLRILAFLHSEDVSETIFEQAFMYGLMHKTDSVNGLDRELCLTDWHVSRAQSLSFIKQDSPSKFSRAQYRQARDILVSLRFVKVDETNDTISTHRPVHQWLRNRLDRARYRETWLTVGSILALATQEKRVNYGFSRHLPHVEAYLCCDRSNCLVGSYRIEVVRIFYCLAWILKESHVLRVAISLARDNLEMASDGVFAPDSQNLMALRYLYGSYLHDSGDQDSAILQLTEVVNWARAELSTMPSELLRVEKKLASCYGSKGCFDRAIGVLRDVARPPKPQVQAKQPEGLSAQRGPAEILQLLEETFKAPKKTTPVERTGRRAALNEVVKALMDDSRPDNAAKLLGEAVERPHTAFTPEDSLKQLMSQFVLAKEHAAKRQYGRSLELLEDVVKVQRGQLPAEDPSHLAARHELARLHTENGRPDKAIKLLRGVVKIEKKNRTPSMDEPSDYVASEHELARAYKCAGQPNKAAQLLERIVKSDEDTLAPNDPRRVASVYELATVYNGTSQYSNAAKLLEEILKSDQDDSKDENENAKALSLNDPARLACTQELARAYRGNGQLHESAQLFEDVADRYQASPDADPASHVTLLQELVDVYRESGETVEAERVLDEIIKMQEQYLSPQDPALLKSKQLLAQL